MHTIGSTVDLLERLFPLRLAAEWDNVGLLLGNRGAALKRLMTCLTVTAESANEAVERRAELIVSHHPILFRASKRLTSDTSEGRMLLELASAGVAVYSPHTAFDNATAGLNDYLTGQLGLQEVRPLRVLPSGKADARQVKVVVFVPDKDLAAVSDAMFAAGAGKIGAYQECSFRLAGTGTFFGTETTNPTVGQKGQREEVNEWRLEVVAPERSLSAVVAALRQAHSYEEPAFDLYPLLSASVAGEGRVGLLPEAVTLERLGAQVKQRLGSKAVGLVGEPQRQVRRVAVVCGSGGDFVSDAVRTGADVLMTGEARFHDYLAARSAGLALVLAGHHATERCGVEHLAARLQTELAGVEVWASQRETDPVFFV